MVQVLHYNLFFQNFDVWFKCIKWNQGLLFDTMHVLTVMASVSLLNLFGNLYSQGNGVFFGMVSQSDYGQLRGNKFIFLWMLNNIGIIFIDRKLRYSTALGFHSIFSEIYFEVYDSLLMLGNQSKGLFFTRSLRELISHGFVKKICLKIWIFQSFGVKILFSAFWSRERSVLT